MLAWLPACCLLALLGLPACLQLACLQAVCNTLPCEPLKLGSCLWQASRNEYGNTPSMTATEADCKEALTAVTLGGEAARLKLAEEVEAVAAEAETARLEAYMQKEEV